MVLFVTDGKPISFYMVPSKHKKDTAKLVTENGGYMTPVRKDAMYQLYNPGDIVSDPKLVSRVYVEDCVRKGQLLDIEKYRYPVRQPIEKRKDVKQVIEGLEFVFTETAKAKGASNDEFDNQSISSQAKHPYTLGEDMAIIKSVLVESKYNSVNGNKIWEILHKRRVTTRTAQSMKERFIKKILPYIENYDLDDLEIKKLKSLQSLKSLAVRCGKGLEYQRKQLPFHKSKEDDPYELSSSDSNSNFHVLLQSPSRRQRHAQLVSFINSTELSQTIEDSEAAPKISKSVMERRKNFTLESVEESEPDVVLAAAPHKNQNLKTRTEVSLSPAGGHQNRNNSNKNICTEPFTIDDETFPSTQPFTIQPEEILDTQPSTEADSLQCAQPSTIDDETFPSTQPFTIRPEEFPDTQPSTEADNLQCAQPSTIDAESRSEADDDNDNAQQFVAEESYHVIASGSSESSFVEVDYVLRDIQLAPSETHTTSQQHSSPKSQLNSQTAWSSFDLNTQALSNISSSEVPCLTLKDSPNTELEYSLNDDALTLNVEVKVIDCVKYPEAKILDSSEHDTSEVSTVDGSISIDSDQLIHSLVMSLSEDSSEAPNQKDYLAQKTSQLINSESGKTRKIERCSSLTQENGNKADSKVYESPNKSRIKSLCSRDDPGTPRKIIKLSTPESPVRKSKLKELVYSAQKSPTVSPGFQCSSAPPAAVMNSQESQYEDCRSSPTSDESYTSVTSSFCIPQKSENPKETVIQSTVKVESLQPRQTISSVEEITRKIPLCEECRCAGHQRVCHVNELKTNPEYVKLMNKFGLSDSEMFAYTFALSADWEVIESNIITNGEVGTYWHPEDDIALLGRNRRNLKELRRKFSSREIKSRKRFLLSRFELSIEQRRQLLSMNKL